MKMKRTRTLLACLTATCLAFCPMSAWGHVGTIQAAELQQPSLTVQDAGISLIIEREPNEQRSEADSAAIGKVLFGRADSAADIDWHAVEVPYDGSLEYTIESDQDVVALLDWQVDLFDSSNNAVACDGYSILYDDDSMFKGKVTYRSRSLRAGTYYVRISLAASKYVNGACYFLSPNMKDVDFGRAAVTVEPATYDGTPQTPAVTVKYGDDTLEEGVDYTVSYSNNNAPGIGQAKVTGMGMFDGSVEVPFAIAADPSSSSGSGGSDGSGSGSGTDSGSGSSSGAGSGSGSGAGTGSDSGSGSSSDSGSGSGTADGNGSGSGSSSGSSDDEGSDSGSGNGEGTGTGETGEGSHTGSGSGTDSGSGSASDSGSTSGSGTGAATTGGIPMYRLYNPNSGEHFYTGNVAEQSNLVSLGWRDEGTGWFAPASGSAVYRLYNPNSGDHHYTLSVAERNMLVSLGWRAEGVGWYSASSADGVPLYRQYNPNALTGNHNYTTAKEENDWLVSLGWHAEGIGWYGLR